jgi:NADH dehydrogenase
VFDLGKMSFMGGLMAMYAWRSVYWSEQVSARTRALLMIDWIIRCVCCFVSCVLLLVVRL